MVSVVETLRFLQRGNPNAIRQAGSDGAQCAELFPPPHYNYLDDEINNLINFMKVQRRCQEQGLPPIPVTLHSVFCGPPGTGKTTV
jgi:SpoVK/Ycf46/Vps4 family AAA+-type ATPase